MRCHYDPPRVAKLNRLAVPTVERLARECLSTAITPNWKEFNSTVFYRRTDTHNRIVIYSNMDEFQNNYGM